MARHFTKYPKNYVRATSDSQPILVTNTVCVDCPRGPYYIWNQFGTFKGSTEDPDRFVVDARKINTFEGFESIEEVIDYVKKYF